MKRFFYSVWFKVILIDLSMKQLQFRNKQRIQTEGYQDVEPWLQMQLDNFVSLRVAGLIDKVIYGNQTVEALAREIDRLTGSEPLLK